MSRSVMMQALSETRSDKRVRARQPSRSWSRNNSHMPPSLDIRDEAPAAARQQSSSRRGRSFRGGPQEAERKPQEANRKSGGKGGISQLQFPDTLTGYVSQVSDLTLSHCSVF